MANVAEHKKQTVQEFAKLIDKYPVIGVVDMSNLPAKTVQTMRAKLRDNNTVLRMTKKRLLKLAFAKTKKQNIPDLEQHFKGLPALIFTNDNPFKLCADLDKTKSSAAAKPGQEAPKDIVVKSGPTSFTPGPIISQLAKYGIKSGVEGGKLAIKEDAVAVKKGEVIDGELAGILTRLGIEPMEIGLNLTAAYENGSIYTSDVLFIDEQEYMSKIALSYSESLNLAVFVGYPTEESLNIMLSKAHSEARSLSIVSGILTDETTEDIIRKAQAEVMSLSNSLPKEAMSSSEPEPKVEEKKVEEEQPKEEETKEKEEPSNEGKKVQKRKNLLRSQRKKLKKKLNLRNLNKMTCLKRKNQKREKKPVR